MQGRRRLTITLAAAAAAAALALPASASAVTVGIADQKAASFADARLRALGLHYARLIVPYDAASSQPAQVSAWLAAVSAAGMTPHVAFEHLSSDKCPGRPCTTPSVATYAADVRRFVAMFPQVRTYTTWNEANHESQPVAGNPEIVASYYDALRAACSACTVVAGDVLDSGSYVRWLQRFEAASTSNPQLWGLHNYGDTTYGTTTGADNVLSTVPGQLWLEETGGIVTLRNALGRITLSTDETRAAQGIDRAFAIAVARPRITRMYVYQWQAKVDDRFDAGLVRPDGTLRPSYTALAKNLAGQSTATAATTTAATLKWSVAWSKARPSQLVLRARCLTSGGRCTGKLRVTLRAGITKRLTTRSYATRASARTATLRITVPAAWRARLRRASVRRLQLRVAPTTPTGAANSVRLKLAKPTTTRRTS